MRKIPQEHVKSPKNIFIGVGLYLKHCKCCPIKRMEENERVFTESIPELLVKTKVCFPQFCLPVRHVRKLYPSIF